MIRGLDNYILGVNDKNAPFNKTVPSNELLSKSIRNAMLKTIEHYQKIEYCLDDQEILETFDIIAGSMEQENKSEEFQKTYNKNFNFYHKI